MFGERVGLSSRLMMGRRCRLLLAWLALLACNSQLWSSRAAEATDQSPITNHEYHQFPAQCRQTRTRIWPFSLEFRRISVILIRVPLFSLLLPRRDPRIHDKRFTIGASSVLACSGPTTNY